MFNTLMSYLSRFSRMILVIFAVLVVAVLVIFTVNSVSENDDGQVTETAAVDSEEQSGVVESSTATSDTRDSSVGEESLSYDGDEGEVQVVIVSEEAIATVNEEGNPQEFSGIAVSEITLDSSDIVTVVTVDEEGNLQSETGQVSSTSTDELGVLPNTGISDTLMTTLGLVAITAAFGALVVSRQNLANSVIGSNR